eukprot:UN00047
MDLYHIIASLSYTYHPSLPFIQGGTSQPAPITFAKHFAEKFSQMITKNDESVNDLHLSRCLKIAPQIVTRVIDLQPKQGKPVKKKGSIATKGKGTVTETNGPKYSKNSKKKPKKKVLKK